MKGIWSQPRVLDSSCGGRDNSVSLNQFPRELGSRRLVTAEMFHMSALPSCNRTVVCRCRDALVKTGRSVYSGLCGSARSHASRPP